MNKVIKVVLVILVIAIIIACGVVMFIKNKNNSNNQNEQNSQDISNNNEDIINLNEIEYEELENLPHEYNIELAKTDKCVAVDFRGNVYNKDLLYAFSENLDNKIASKIRIVQETIDKTVSLTDLYYSGDILSVSIDNTRIDETIDSISNLSYDLLYDYTFEKRIESLEDGTEVERFVLVNNADGKENVINLITYSLYEANPQEEVLNSFEAEILSVTEDGYVEVRPLEGFDELNVSQNIYLNLSASADTYIVGENIRVSYSNGIEELDGRNIINSISHIDFLEERN